MLDGHRGRKERKCDRRRGSGAAAASVPDKVTEVSELQRERGRVRRRETELHDLKAKCGLTRPQEGFYITSTLTCLKG